jgi:hypothetical protein
LRELLTALHMTTKAAKWLGLGHTLY